MEDIQQKLVPVNIEIGEIELPKIDVNPYIGKRVKIANVETMTGGAFGNYTLRVQTEIVATVEGGKKPIDLRGSIIFGLSEDSEGKIGWGSETKLGKFLKQMKVKLPSELKGKEVTLQKQVSKTGTGFLTIVA